MRTRNNPRQKTASAKKASAKKTKKKTMNKSTPNATKNKVNKTTMKTSKNDKKTVPSQDSADVVGSPDVTSQPPKNNEENADVVDVAVAESSAQGNNAVKVASQPPKNNEENADVVDVAVAELSAQDNNAVKVASQPPKNNEENANVVDVAVADSSAEGNNAVKVAVVDSSTESDESTAETENVTISGGDCMKIPTVDTIQHFLLVKDVASNKAKIVDTGEIDLCSTEFLLEVFVT